MTKHNNEFEPVYLFTDHAKLFKLKKDYQNVLVQLPALKLAATNLIGCDLRKNELDLLFVDKAAFVASMKKVISKRFMFPEATISFNLVALGLNFDELDDAAAAIQEHDFLFDIDEAGEYSLLDTEFERFKEMAKVYTATPKQNEALEIFESILIALDKLKSLGVNYTQSFIYRAFPSYFAIGANDTIKVSVQRISEIK